MKPIQILCLLVGVLLLCSCKSTNLPSTGVPAYIKDFMSHNSQFDYAFALNPNEDYVLCVEYPKSSRSEETRYAVYKIANDSMVYKNAFIGGQVSWYNEAELKLTNNTRIKESSFQVINILTGESRVTNVEINNKL